MREIEPGLEWEVDFMRPEEAPQVVDLFKLVYGEGYPIQLFLDPDELAKQNREENYISSVARTSKGDIVGHNAIYRVAPYPGVFESGAGLVHPAYRGGKGIFTQMAVHGYRHEKHRDKVEVALGEPVCNLPYAQKATKAMDMVCTAVEVDLMPAAAYSQEKSAAGRVTTLMTFDALKPRPHKVYLPPRHREAMLFCYSDLGDEREFAQGSASLPASGSRLSAQYFSFAQVARWCPCWPAPRIWARVIAAEEESLRTQGALMIEMWLPLSWPWSGRGGGNPGRAGLFLWRALAPAGSIMTPWLFLKTVDAPGWDHISIAFERNQKIVDMAKADWQRVGQK